MWIVMAVLLVLCLWGAKVAGFGKFHRDYCSPGKTNALKGVFVLFVFLSHMRGYVALSEADRAALTVVKAMGQLMVVPFLLYSGYGIMESIRKKGDSYIRSIPRNRILKTLLHFDLAVLAFLLVRLVVGKSVTITQFLLSLVAIRGIGNSNWYVFVILLLYVITAAAFRIFRKNTYGAAAVATVLSVAAVLVMRRFCPLYWHDTLLCYVLGLWFSLLREPVEKILFRHDLIWLAAAAAALTAFRWIWYHYDAAFAPHGFALVFAVLLILGSAKLSLDNPFLQYLGKNTFWLYILQRIPMILMQHFGLWINMPWAFFLVSFLLTCVLAWVFQRAVDKLDSFVFGKK